ncbi:conserved hypothetical protein [uncultured Mycobacterium sp.]|uniref:Uncharacterized protein n=1 Tax=uncultured Mycobacterium sp. TaxID=171292 RepID=A0A1Y5PLL0_9MYCO|nr:hypothetical protein MycrhDRAFT_6993 [Mycolicibacterium rhodesiae JS60]SBS79616.1 conserved hypothetical protein [uncultured Mycobacterium sp.]
MSSPEIQQIVAQVYTDYDLLPSVWPPRRQRAFLDAEAARLSRQVAELAADLSEHAIADWTARAGHHPDMMTKVGLLNTATMQAKEIVLTRELYDLIPLTPEDLDDAPSVPPDRSELAWDRRWTRTQYRTDPTDDLETLAAAVWPSPAYSAVFRIKAGYLLAARAEDRLPLPRNRDDPLAAELAQMVYADLRADGLPARPHTGVIRTAR